GSLLNVARAASRSAVLFCFVSQLVAAAEVRVTSPDQATAIRVFQQDARLRYEITANQHTVIESSPLAVSVDGVELTRDAGLGKATRSDINESYPWRGVHSRAVNR